MQYEKLGHTALQFSKIILGTWQAGKNMWADIDDRETTKAIARAVELGMTTIDTAMVYGEGHSERIIGMALKSVPRTRYQLATKVFSNKLKYEDVLKECTQSLKNLQTDYIDLYQIHWPSGSFGSDIVPIADTMRALNQLKQDGKILQIGVSNFSREQIIEALTYGDIVSNQPPYSLLWRAYDKTTNPFCREKHIAILAYSPLAQGILTGKFKKGHQFKAGDHRGANKLMQPDIFERIEKILAQLQIYADRYHTTLGNIALNWLISQPYTFAIVGARDTAQVEMNAKACDFKLTTQELTEIEHLSHLVTDVMEQTEIMWNF